MTMFSSFWMASAGADTFEVDNSAMFNDASDQYLKKVYTTTGTSNKTITLSTWLKRGRLGANSQGHQQNLIGFQNSAQFLIEITTADKIRLLAENNAGGVPIDWTSDLVLRDPHAWYHIVWTLSTLGSPVNKVWLNGTEVTGWTKTNDSLAQDDAFPFGSTTSSAGIATRASYSVQDYDGYLAETVYMDGTVQTDATNFGEYDGNGVWRPKDLTDTFALSSTAEAIANVSSATTNSQLTTYTYSSVALGTASATRAIYVFVTAQEPGTAPPDIQTLTVGGVDATRVSDVSNSVEPQYYVSELWKADVPTGTTGDIVVTWNTDQSRCGVIAWAVTGDHNLFDLQTSSNTSASFTLTGVPDGSVILAGRGGTGGKRVTWGSDVTENVDEDIEPSGVCQSGASSAKSTGGNFTVTCARTDGTTDSRARTVALVLSPKQGATGNSFYLPFTTADYLGADYKSDYSTTTTSAHFDGSNDYLDRGAALTGISDGPRATIAFWYRVTGRASNDRVVMTSQDGMFDVTLDVGNNWKILGHISSGHLAINYESNITQDVDHIWHHFMASFDNADGGGSGKTFKVYIDGVDRTGSDLSTHTGNIDWDRAGFRVGTYAHSTGVAKKWQGDLAEVYFATEYLDLSQSSNRLKFLSASGTPVDLGADGSTPTGTQPILYLANPFGTFQNNLGSGGNFSVVGALTAGAGVRSIDAKDFGAINSPTQTTDTPTNNHCVWSDVFPKRGGNWTLSEGNRKATYSSSTDCGCPGSIGVSGAGTWYYEITASSSYTVAGLVSETAVSSSDLASTTSSNGFSDLGGVAYGYYANNGYKMGGPSNVHASYGATFANTDVIGVAFDAANGTLTFYKNGATQGEAFTSIDTSETWFPFVHTFTNEPGVLLNNGQTAFAHTPPTGYVGINTTNLLAASAPTIEDGSAHFQATTYSGVNGANSIEQSGNSTFQPDIAWIKRRDGTGANGIFDSVRTSGEYLRTNANNAEATESSFSGFDANGFNFSAADTDLESNTAGRTYVGWQWKAGGSASANNDGNTTVQLSANPTAGFSIGTFNSGVQGSGITLGHGLGVAPKMIWMKTSSAVTPWWIFHEDVGNTKYLQFGATGNLTPATNAKVWRNTSPSTSAPFVFTTSGEEGGSGWLADNQDNVFYAFAEIPGFSKFGSFSSVSSGDPLVHCGFTPALIFLKRTSSNDDWYVHDTTRDPNNPAYRYLIWNTTAQEASNSSVYIDIISNGFVCDLGGIVTANNDMVFGAWAENPFAGTTPVTAR